MKSHSRRINKNRPLNEKQGLRSTPFNFETLLNLVWNKILLFQKMDNKIIDSFDKNAILLKEVEFPLKDGSVQKLPILLYNDPKDKDSGFYFDGKVKINAAHHKSEADIADTLKHEIRHFQDDLLQPNIYTMGTRNQKEITQTILYSFLNTEMNAYLESFAQFIKHRLTQSAKDGNYPDINQQTKTEYGKFYSLYLEHEMAQEYYMTLCTIFKKISYFQSLIYQEYKNESCREFVIIMFQFYTEFVLQYKHRQNLVGKNVQYRLNSDEFKRFQKLTGLTDLDAKIDADFLKKAFKNPLLKKIFVRMHERVYNWVHKAVAIMIDTDKKIRDRYLTKKR